MEGTIPLFGEELPREITKYPRRLRDMWQFYGQAEGEVTCSECPQFLRREYHNRNYFKCQKSTITAGPATDWRASWPACGLVYVKNGEVAEE